MEHAEISSTLSAGYICQLWDLHSLLVYRAGQAEGSEKRLLLAQADEVNTNIAKYLDKDPSDIKKLTDIRDLKKLIRKST